MLTPIPSTSCASVSPAGEESLVGSGLVAVVAVVVVIDGVAVGEGRSAVTDAVGEALAVAVREGDGDGDEVTEARETCPRPFEM